MEKKPITVKQQQKPQQNHPNNKSHQSRSSYNVSLDKSKAGVIAKDGAVALGRSEAC